MEAWPEVDLRIHRNKPRSVDASMHWCFNLPAMPNARDRKIVRYPGEKVIELAVRLWKLMCPKKQWASGWCPGSICIPSIPHHINWLKKLKNGELSSPRNRLWNFNASESVGPPFFNNRNQVCWCFSELFWNWGVQYLHTHRERERNLFVLYCRDWTFQRKVLQIVHV